MSADFLSYPDVPTPLDGTEYFPISQRGKNFKIKKTDLGGDASFAESITAGENLQAGDLIYLGTDSKWYKTDYLSEAKVKTELRIVKDATILADATGLVYNGGIMASTGLTAGAVYYVGANGGITATIPEIEGIFQRKIGTALSATEMEFLPDQTYLEITLMDTLSAGTFVSQETAGETISSGKIVYTLAGKIYNFDPADASLYGRAFGLSKTSAVLNGAIDIQWSGKFYEAGLGLTQDEIYFAGTNGLPTTNITGFNLIQPIGFARDSNTLMINFTTAFLTT